MHGGDLSLNITSNLTQGGECITRYELHQKHNCKNGDYLRMQIGFSIVSSSDVVFLLSFSDVIHQKFKTF